MEIRPISGPSLLSIEMLAARRNRRFLKILRKSGSQDSTSAVYVDEYMAYGRWLKSTGSLGWSWERRKPNEILEPRSDRASRGQERGREPMCCLGAHKCKYFCSIVNKRKELTVPRRIG
jgi:hypothetical protein